MNYTELAVAFISGVITGVIVMILLIRKINGIH